LIRELLESYSRLSVQLRLKSESVNKFKKKIQDLKMGIFESRLDLLGSMLGDKLFSLRSFDDDHIQILNIRIPANEDYYRLPLEHLNASFIYVSRFLKILGRYFHIEWPFEFDLRFPVPRISSSSPFIFPIVLSSDLDSPSSLIPLFYP